MRMGVSSPVFRHEDRPYIGNVAPLQEKHVLPLGGFRLRFDLPYSHVSLASEPYLGYCDLKETGKSPVGERTVFDRCNA